MLLCPIVGQKSQLGCYSVLSLARKVSLDVTLSYRLSKKIGLDVALSKCSVLSLALSK